MSTSSQIAVSPRIMWGGFRNVLERFLLGFATHRSLYIIALFTFVLGLVVAPVGDYWPFSGKIVRYGNALAFAVFVGVMAGMIIKFFQMALVEKPKSPARAMLGWMKETIFCGDRLVNTAHSYIALVFFITGFGVLKGSIGLLNPFDWDVFFRDLDIAVSFGSMPHEWLGWLISSSFALCIINFNYHLWFFIILGSYFAVGMSAHSTIDRMRYLNAIMLLWLIAGVFVAFTFSSAGPVYFERLGNGTDYASLMANLQAANQQYPIWALAVQDGLWATYTGVYKGYIGISAFPSMHVASSVLLAIYATHFCSWLAVPAWLFTAVILLGSVVLGWHYAVDGYAGALLAWLVWKLSSWRLLYAFNRPLKYQSTQLALNGLGQTANHSKSS